MIRFKGALGLLSFLTSLSVNHSLTLAQITPDQTLGAESAIVIPFNQLLQLIQGGAIRGENLFQSYQAFSILDGQTIILANPDGVNNILIRVTGNDPSHLLGTLGLIKQETINNILLGSMSPTSITIQDFGTANLFFLNPNGILFGENASLNVGGSFIATTANQIQFADGTIFSADVTQSSPLLTISTPIGLQFTQPNSKPIIVQGNDKPLNGFLQSITPDTTSEEVLTITNNVLTEVLSRPLQEEGLNVFPNKTLALVGGDINLEGGIVTALGGRIEIGSIINGGTVSLTPISNGWQLGYEGIEPKNQGTINLNQLALINPDILGQGNGAINIQGKNLNLTNESAIISFTLSDINGQDIKIKSEEINLSNGSILTTGTINLDNSGRLTVLGNSGDLIIDTDNFTAQSSSFIGSVSLNSQGTSGDLIIKANGNITLESAFMRAVNFSEIQGGDIFLQAQNVNLMNGSLISGETIDGPGGNLTIEASESLNLITTKDSIDTISLIFTDTIGEGDAGTIKIMTKNLVLFGRAAITAEVESEFASSARGGDILIDASESISLTGFNTGISTASGNIGNAGNIKITTKDLNLREGAIISTSTLNQGQGGNLAINAFGSIILQDTATGIFSTTQGDGNAGSIKLITPYLSLVDGAIISAATRRNGQGGLISINADKLVLDNQSQITTFSQSQGNAGNINLTVTDLNLHHNSQISAETQKEGKGGEINITAQDIRLYGNSDIRTNVESGEGGGGNITLTANSIINFNDSDILAFARDGRGGNITLNTPAFFGDGYQPTSSVANPDTLDSNGRVDINASGAVFGVILIPDLTFIQNSFVQLPNSLINPESLISNRCITPNDSESGQFIIKGSGGLPNRPNTPRLPQYPTGDVQPLPNDDNAPTWQKGDPIIEPQGIYRSPEGRIFLSRDCSP
jgi:filamentous hemagglutinin family protein